MLAARGPPRPWESRPGNLGKSGLANKNGPPPSEATAAGRLPKAAIGLNEWPGTERRQSPEIICRSSIASPGCRATDPGPLIHRGVREPRLPEVKPIARGPRGGAVAHGSGSYVRRAHKTLGVVPRGKPYPPTPGRQSQRPPLHHGAPKVDNPTPSSYADAWQPPRQLRCPVT